MSDDDGSAAISVDCSEPGWELRAKQSYRDHGVVVCQSFFDAATELAPLRDAVRAIIGLQRQRAGAAPLEPAGDADFDQGLLELEAEGHGAVATAYDLLNSHPGLFHYASHPKVQGLVDLLLNDKSTNQLVVNGLQLRMDFPNNESELLSWHRDMDYYPQMPASGCVMWVPLRAAGGQGGGISMVTEAVRQEAFRSEQVVKHWPGRAKPHTVQQLADPEPSLKELRATEIQAGAGDAVFFSMLQPHKSDPNRGEQVRWTMQIRFYSASDVAQVGADRAKIEGSGG